MDIRPALTADMDEIMRIYARARDYMAANGNPTQWGDGYPRRELLINDIARQQLFVCVDSDGLCGVFAFISGDDPTYADIEGGAWLNERPYSTIHRVASDGRVPGLLKQCIDYCLARDGNLRIDTHADNVIMQHLLEKHGFKRCGIIYVEDGSPRIAYQYAN